MTGSKHRDTAVWRNILAVLTVLAAPGVWAADQHGLFSIRGAGLLTCGTFVAEREKASEAYMMMGGWLDGYITGVNELAESTFDITPFQSTELVSLLVYRHCRDNSEDLIFAVVNTLLARLHDQRLTSASPYTDVRVGERQVRLYDSVIRDIQSALAGKGLLAENPDGSWNAATATALSRFQATVGLESSGFPDQTTLWYLLRENV